MTNVYLDIAGTLVYTNQYGQRMAALGLEELLVSLRPHTTFWLTTYCTDGDPTRAQEIMKALVPTSLHEDIMRVRPTVWSVQKTEGVDWTQPFIWLDDTIGPEERRRFTTTLPQQRFIQINLHQNPHQLHDIAALLSTI